MENVWSYFEEFPHDEKTFVECWKFEPLGAFHVYRIN